MSALKKTAERRKYRRVSDAVALQITSFDEAASEQNSEACELPQSPTHVVSLSPTGLKCYYHEPFNTGDILQLSIRLFPSGERFDAQAKVVNSGKDESSRNNRYFAGLSFKGLSQEQRSQMLEHLDGIARQSFGGAVKLVN